MKLSIIFILFLVFVSNFISCNSNIENKHESIISVGKPKDHTNPLPYPKISIDSSFAILTKEKKHYNFGYWCGEGGGPPLGRKAIKNLVFEKRIDLIKIILDSNSNLGKTYAIEALLEFNLTENILSIDEKEKISLIIQEDFEINTCDGCFGFLQTSKTIFSEGTLKELLAKNLISILEE